MTESLFTPPTQRALHSHVYDALRRAIITGVLKSGQRVNELEVARQMQISRAPIREAIRQLEQEGLLVNVPRRGTFVMSLTVDDIAEVYTLRADIESRAVQQAMPHLTPEVFETLEGHFARMREAAQNDDIPSLLDADIQFHRTIVETAGWPRLKRIWESFHPQTLTLYTMTTLTDWAPSVHAERHAAVLEALRSGDPDRGVAAIREHILAVGDRVLQRTSSAAVPSIAR